MNFKYSQLNDMKEFAKYLSNVLEKTGHKDKSKMVNDFSYNSYTTSSEYLGELKVLLVDLKSQNIISDNEIILEIDAAIKAINKAFGN